MRALLVLLALCGCGSDECDFTTNVGDRLTIHVTSPTSFTILSVTFVGNGSVPPRRIETESTTTYDVLYETGFHHNSPDGAMIVAYQPGDVQVANGTFSGFDYVENADFCTFDATPTAALTAN